MKPRLCLVFMVLLLVALPGCSYHGRRIIWMANSPGPNTMDTNPVAEAALE